MNKEGILYIVSAPSGAGKTSISKEVLKKFNSNGERPLNWSISYTTRPRREGEVHGQDYWFVDDVEFDRMTANNDFAEWARVHDHRYGTSSSYLEQARKSAVDLLLEIDCQGARQLKETYGKGVYVFVLPPSSIELERRLRGRGTDKDDAIERRLVTARKEVGEWTMYDYVIVNENFQTAVEELSSIITAERLHREVVESRVVAILSTFGKGEN